jgi:hypothetical protein
MTRTRIIIIGVIIVLIFIGYGVFFKGDKKDDTGLVSSAARRTEGQVGVKILSALSTLETLNLDTKFFSNSMFKSLKNFSKDVQKQPEGRSNPFAPIGTGSAASSVTATTSPR